MIKLIYIRDKNKKPIGCIVSEYDTKTNYVSYGLSVRHPLDSFDKNGKMVKFDKVAARAMAIKDMEDNCHRGIDILETSPTAHHINYKIMCDIIDNNKEFPSQAVKFAKRWVSRKVENDNFYLKGDKRKDFSFREIMMNYFRQLFV